MEEPRESFLRYVKKRIFVISTLEADARLTFMGGLAAIVLAVTLNVFHEYLGPPVETIVGTVPVVVLAVLGLGETLVFFLVALAVLLIGGRWRWILSAGLGASFIVFAWANEFDPWSFALFVPLAMLAACSWIGRRQKWSGRNYALAALSVSLATMTVIVLYAVLNEQALIVSALGLQALLAMIGLCLAAVDIAEVSLVAVETTAALVRQASHSTPLVFVFALAACLTALLLPLVTTGGTPQSIAQFLGASFGLTLWLGLLFWMAVARRGKLGAPPVHIGYRVLFAIVAVYFLALQAGIAWRVLSDPTTYDAGRVFTYPQVFEFTSLIGLLAVLAYLGVLVTRRGAQVLVSLFYTAVVGMFMFHYFASHGDALVSIVSAMGFGGLLILGFSLASSKARSRYGDVCETVGVAMIAFVLYGLTATLFLSLRGTGGFSAGQAAIVLAALAWDILTSGEAVTNGHSANVPRLSRIALFFAYTISVAQLVMVSSSAELVNPATGQKVEGVFESEPLVAIGLALFGLPFIFAMMSMRFRAVLAEADKARTVKDPAVPAVSPAG